METKKGGIWQTPFCLFRSPIGMGKLKEIWLSSNRHNFSNGDRSFLIARKKGMPHFFWEPPDDSLRNLSKKMTTLLLWQLKQFGHLSKNSDNRMAIENFQSPHVVPIWSTPMVIENKIVATRMGDWKNLVIPFCGN
jgi:hypothetical protein